jgi:hypothetical protein
MKLPIQLVNFIEEEGFALVFLTHLQVLVFAGDILHVT